MPLGFENSTTLITMEHLNNLTNVSSLSEFYINVNHTIYGGWLYFILLLVFMVIIFIAANRQRDQILNNLMYSGAATTVISFIFRAIFIVKDGIYYGLLTDSQLWIFPIFTIILALIVYSTKS